MKNLPSYILAMLIMVVLMTGWMLVQNAWRRLFPVSDAHQDVLAGRGGCQGCRCSGVCERDAAETGETE